MPDALNLTPGDLKKGHRELKNEVVVSLTTTDPALVRLTPHAVSAGRWSAVDVAVRGAGALDLLPGKTIDVAVPTPDIAEGAVRLHCVFRVPPGTAPVRHPWPLEVHFCSRRHRGRAGPRCPPGAGSLPSSNGL